MRRTAPWTSIVTLICLLAAAFASAQTAPATAPPPDVVFLPMPTAGKPIALAEIDTPRVKLTMVGSLGSVKAGTLAPWDFTTVAPDEVAFAFGLGTSTTMDATSDLVTLGGRTVLRNIDPTFPGRTLDTWDHDYRVPYGALLYAKDINAVFPRVYRFAHTPGVPLSDLLDQLATGAGEPVLVRGWVELPALSSEAFTKAPVFAESLAAQKTAYLEPITGEKVSFAFVALAMPPAVKVKQSQALLAKAAFDAPIGPRGTSQFALSGALIKESVLPEYVTSPLVDDALRAATVLDVVHMDSTMPNPAVASRGLFMVYRLKL